MKKAFLLICFIIFSFSSCEKDDFCTENPVTPHLVLRFYDNANRNTLKTVQNLSIYAANKDTLIDYTSVNLDSVAIPLNAIANETVYFLKMNNTNGATATNETAKFTIQYTPEPLYVSRSCGYKITYNTVSFSTDPNTWILDFTPSTLTAIDNQNNAHVQIFH